MKKDLTAGKGTEMCANLWSRSMPRLQHQRAMIVVVIINWIVMANIARSIMIGIATAWARWILDDLEAKPKRNDFWIRSNIFYRGTWQLQEGSESTKIPQIVIKGNVVWRMSNWNELSEIKTWHCKSWTQRRAHVASKAADMHICILVYIYTGYIRNNLVCVHRKLVTPSASTGPNVLDLSVFIFSIFYQMPFSKVRNSVKCGIYGDTFMKNEKSTTQFTHWST